MCRSASPDTLPPSLDEMSWKFRDQDDEPYTEVQRERDAEAAVCSPAFVAAIRRLTRMRIAPVLLAAASGFGQVGVPPNPPPESVHQSQYCQCISPTPILITGSL
jgi:hypothetical protein